MATVFPVLLMFAFTAQAGVFSDDVSAAYSKNDKESAKGSKDSKSTEDEKVTLCHSPPGNPESFQTLSVAQEAVSAHLEHGDLLGACAEVEPVDSVESVKPARPSSQRSVYGQ